MSYPIYEALNTIRVYLESMFRQWDRSDCTVTLNSLSKDDAVKNDNDGDIMITLLRIEEETGRKQQLPVVNKVDGSYKYEFPNACFNLHVLISSQADDYGTALKQISRVIYWVNSISNLMYVKEGEDSIRSMEPYRSIAGYELMMECLSAEQNNSMWQTLGVRMVPSVAYKVRMVEIGSNEFASGPSAVVGVDQYGVSYEDRAGADGAVDWPVKLMDGFFRKRLEDGIISSAEEAGMMVDMLKYLKDKFTDTVLSELEKQFIKDMEEDSENYRKYRK